jgi:DNA-binding transcriptional MocR family regulator
MADETKVSGETPAQALARLKQQEATTGRSGAIPRMPKEMMFDASDVEAKHPDKHFRWLNMADKNKMASRKVEGYTILPESEGGRKLGDDMVLASIPREQFEQRVARQREENDRRLNSHTKEWSEQAESAARILRDQYGIKVSPEKLTRL